MTWAIITVGTYIIIEVIGFGSQGPGGCPGKYSIQSAYNIYTEVTKDVASQWNEWKVVFTNSCIDNADSSCPLLEIMYSTIH